jgi:hypothetical protein
VSPGHPLSGALEALAGRCGWAERVPARKGLRADILEDRLGVRLQIRAGWHLEERFWPGARAARPWEEVRRGLGL